MKGVLSMKTNVGTTDRIIRLIIGIILVTVGIFFKSWIIVLVGVLALLTGIVGWCYLYVPFGINTRKTKQPDNDVTEKKE